MVCLSSDFVGGVGDRDNAGVLGVGDGGVCGRGWLFL